MKLRRACRHQSWETVGRLMGYIRPRSACKVASYAILLVEAVFQLGEIQVPSRQRQRCVATS